MRITLRTGDITAETCDAIVNAANSSLLGGGGVDGAIHRAAGPDLLEECRKVRAEQLPDGLPAGQAVATPAGNLSADWVIHTVGPNRHAGQADPEVLVSCYAESLREAQRMGARTVAFPAIGAGVYGWSASETAEAAGQACSAQGWEGIDEVRFVLFSPDIHAAFAQVFTEADG